MLVYFKISPDITLNLNNLVFSIKHWFSQHCFLNKALVHWHVKKRTKQFESPLYGFQVSRDIITSWIFLNQLHLPHLYSPKLDCLLGVIVDDGHKIVTDM